MVTQTIGVLGTGMVGSALAKGLADLGYEVSIGSRDGHAVDGWDGAVGTFADVATKADVVLLAVKGAAAVAVVESVKDGLAGKTVIDTTNPIAADKPAEDGVLRFFTNLDESLLEQLQAAVPEAHFVKAFNSTGAGNMVQPDYSGSLNEGGKPTMFIAGDNADAKAEASQLIGQLGWEAADLGSAKAARAIEPLCMLICIPGLRDNQWTSALKLLQR